MPKPKFVLNNNISEPKKPHAPTPREIRGNIGELENRIASVQSTPLPANPAMRNRQIDWLGKAQAKVRELYIILYDLQERGRVIMEKQRKRELAWKEFIVGCKKAGYCPESKARVDDDCEECEFHVTVFTEKPASDDPATLTEDEIKEIIKSHDDPDTTLKVVFHPDRAKEILKEKK